MMIARYFLKSTVKARRADDAEFRAPLPLTCGPPLVLLPRPPPAQHPPPAHALSRVPALSRLHWHLLYSGHERASPGLPGC